MFLKWFLIASLCSVGVARADVGFSSGHQLTVVPIQGQVQVSCPGGLSASYFCRDTAMDPASYDYFQGPVGIIADSVQLIAIRPDGSQRSVSVGYDSTQGRSSDAVNLWISTLFQRPLLQIGLNDVSYSLTHQSQVVSSGQFQVTVTHGDLRLCPGTKYNSPDSTDCSSQYSVCQRYFEQYNFCRQ